MSVVDSKSVPFEEAHAEMAVLENRPVISYQVPGYIGDLDDGYMFWSPAFGIYKAANTVEAAQQAVIREVDRQIKQCETFEEREEFVKSHGALYNIYHPDGTKEYTMRLTVSFDEESQAHVDE